jgi:hypothetical protein
MSGDVTCQEGSVEELPALWDIPCQVTRGRQPAWAPTPFARWLREQLERRGHNKKWLGEQIARVGGGTQAAADRQVTRWTYAGEPPTAATLDPKSLTAVRQIFDADPPGASDAAVTDLVEQLATVLDRFEELATRLEELLNGQAGHRAARSRPRRAR